MATSRPISAPREAKAPLRPYAMVKPRSRVGLESLRDWFIISFLSSSRSHPVHRHLGARAGYERVSNHQVAQTRNSARFSEPSRPRLFDFDMARENRAGEGRWTAEH